MDMPCFRMMGKQDKSSGENTHFSSKIDKVVGAQMPTPAIHFHTTEPVQKVRNAHEKEQSS